jgi:hypothetical protein
VTRLLDVNLLMALLWENHEHHTKARLWFKGVSAFASCPVVQLGFGLTPELAFGVLRQFIADPRHEFIPDDLSCADRVVRTELMSGANQITDRYLVAVARQHGFSLATLDGPLAKSFTDETGLVELLH